MTENKKTLEEYQHLYEKVDAWYAGLKGIRKQVAKNNIKEWTERWIEDMNEWIDHITETQDLLELEEEEEEEEECETCWICKKTDATVHTIDYWPGHSGHDITVCSACNNEECESCGTKDGTVVPHLYGNSLSMMVCSACK